MREVQSNASELKWQCAIWLLLGVCCFALSWYRQVLVATDNAIDRRQKLESAMPWMIQALPGIGPVKATAFLAQLQEGQPAADLHWPKSSKPYLDQLFMYP